MGRHGFPVIFPAKVWHAAASSCMVLREASALMRIYLVIITCTCNGSPWFSWYSGMLRLYKIFQQAVPPVSDLRLMCHLLNNCSLYMSTILIYLLSIKLILETINYFVAMTTLC